MITSYGQAVARATEHGPVPVAVAAAEERELLETLDLAAERGLCRPVLVGDAVRLKGMTADLRHLAGVEIVDVADPAAAAVTAARLVGEGHAEVLVKGMVNSSDFLRGVLAPEAGLRSGHLLSHLACFEIPGQPKLQFQTDGGMNVAPDLEKKVAILDNALGSLRAMGLAEPKVAVLTANEKVSPKMPATTDAAALTEMCAQGRFGDAVVEGPIALDVAVSREAADAKGIVSRVSGDVDLLLMPSIEAGNLMGKSLVHFADARMAGLVVGTRKPVVMTSRSDSPTAKINSIALACVVALATQQGGSPATAGTTGHEGNAR